jgi:ferredoxin
MHATRSARNNITEGGAILDAAVDNNKDLYAECHTPDNIINSNITEGVPSLPPVESKVTAYQAKSKVTACNAMRLTCSARNDIREGGSILEVVMDDESQALNT